VAAVEHAARLGHGCGAIGIQPHAGQGHVEQLADIRLVVDDENPP
jgi:hypothetical protein